jgi:hypothetical protein
MQASTFIDAPSLDATRLEMETNYFGTLRMCRAFAAALPAADGLACFNRMHLDVTRQVNSQLGQGFFADPACAGPTRGRLR